MVYLEIGVGIWVYGGGGVIAVMSSAPPPIEREDICPTLFVVVEYQVSFSKCTMVCDLWACADRLFCFFWGWRMFDWR